jgi:hypothetical protein
MYVIILSSYDYTVIISFIEQMAVEACSSDDSLWPGSTRKQLEQEHQVSIQRF